VNSTDLVCSRALSGRLLEQAEESNSDEYPCHREAVLAQIIMVLEITDGAHSGGAKILAAPVF